MIVLAVQAQTGVGGGGAYQAMEKLVGGVGALAAMRQVHPGECVEELTAALEKARAVIGRRSTTDKGNTAPAQAERKSIWKTMVRRAGEADKRDGAAVARPGAAIEVTPRARGRGGGGFTDHSDQ